MSPPPCRLFNPQGIYEFQMTFDCELDGSEISNWRNESVKMIVLASRDVFYDADYIEQGKDKVFTYSMDLGDVN